MLVSWHYKYRGSPMDHIDPRARWIFSFAFLIAATSTWNSAMLAVLFGIAVIWYSLGRTTWKETRRGWTLVLIMLFTMIIVNTIITGGGAGGVVPEGGKLVWPDGVRLFGRLLRPGLTVDRIWFAICQLASLFGKVSDFCSKKCSFPSGFEEFFMMPQFSPDVIKLVPGYLQVMSEIIPRLLKVFQLI